MGVQVEGVNIKVLKVSKDSEGKTEVTGDYDLMATGGLVLAKQSFNDYNDIKLTLSPDTIRIIREFNTAVKTDLEATLGLN